MTQSHKYGVKNKTREKNKFAAELMNRRYKLKQRKRAIGGTTRYLSLL